VEYVRLDDDLFAVVVDATVVVLRELGSVATVERDLDALRYGLRRLAYRVGSEESLDAAAALVRGKARRLDAQLVQPLMGQIADAPLVIAPTGALHAMPWSVLPSLVGRPVSVAPSAALWQRAAAGASDIPGRCVLASGPRLPYAAAEVASLARQYRHATRFSGRRAQVAAVTSALDGAETVHLAAHGHFREDNPLFSSIELADGPLTVYDLERLNRAPRHVVLSTCDSGLPLVRPGDEVLGLAAALLSLGTTSLVATVVPVPDDMPPPHASFPPSPPPGNDARRRPGAGAAGTGRERVCDRPRPSDRICVLRSRMNK
jgi:hypothetical protein